MTMTNPTPVAIVQEAAEKVTHKSKWGYHICSSDGYWMLRRLRYLLSLYERRHNAFDRWSCKLPHNRVAYTYRRTTTRPSMARGDMPEGGWKNGVLTVTPQPAPEFIPPTWPMDLSTHIEFLYRLAKYPMPKRPEEMTDAEAKEWITKTTEKMVTVTKPTRALTRFRMLRDWIPGDFKAMPAEFYADIRKTLTMVELWCEQNKIKGTRDGVVPPAAQAEA